jgi:predicted membrane channel-forming protein YqfA (hemolysin III family)
MVLADTYNWTFGDFMLGVLDIFMFVVWFWLLVSVFNDLFRRHDIGGGMKVLWAAIVIITLWFGVLIYILVNGRGMAERNQKQVDVAREQMRSAAGYSSADELEKLKTLHSAGTLSDDEYAKAKANVLG